MSKRVLLSLGLLVTALAGVLALVAALAQRSGGRDGAAPPPEAEATFVGGRACAACHEDEYAAWKDSHHALAMQEANDETVLGDFADRRFTYAGVTSLFSRRGGGFYVTTDGPDGQLREYRIEYTFGVTPLQQYLVEFPGGRLQALPFAWDSRPAEQGGGRWFHLYPAERLDHRDPLHWTRPAQNWNWMCAECHSTGLRRNYDLTSDSYETRWTEINVSCEACHGPGSRHVEWARHVDAGGEDDASLRAARAGDGPGLTVRLDERREATWGVDPTTGRPARSRPRTTRREIDTCGLCHARRAPVGDGLAHGGQLMDSHDPSLLTEGLYFPDGQQHDEVYTYGSFLQSTMNAHGVTCSDCHDPHSARLRLPGNAVCLRCHAQDEYDVPAHTLHGEGSAGGRCAACHMPARTYMGIDARHDHAIRVPRPDLGEQFGVPDACANCHRDKGARWAASALERAFGARPNRPQGFVAALHAARTGAPGAAAALTALVVDDGASAIARATALTELRHLPGVNGRAAVESGLRETDPLVRAAATEALAAFDQAERLRLAEPLLDDPVKVVRLKAARVLAATRVEGLTEERRARLERAFAEFVSSQAALAERPEPHMNLAAFFSARGDPRRAEAAYRTALRLHPWFVPGYVNLADHFRRLGREQEAETTLVKGLAQVPGDGDLSHALALVRVRQGRRADAMALLRHAAEQRPANPRYPYVYAVALHDAGRPDEGLAVLERALARFPNDRDMLFAAALYASDAGRPADASRHASRFAAVAPDDPRREALARRVRSR